MKLKRVVCFLLSVLVILTIAAMPASAWVNFNRDLKNSSYKEYWNNGKALEYHKGSAFPYDDIWSATSYEIPTKNMIVNGSYITGKVYTRCEATNYVARQADSTWLDASAQRFYCSTLKVGGKT